MQKEGEKKQKAKKPRQRRSQRPLEKDN
jgi:hypothetical protein